MSDAIQYCFYVDTTKCTGCKACHISCKDRQGEEIRNATKPVENGVPSLNGVNWRRVYEYGGGSWNVDPATGTFEQDVFAYYMSIGCNHCSEPVCVKACPTGAMHKRREDGLVHVAEDLCIACESCSRACPYDAPQLDQERKVMTKCDGCYDRLAEGRKPICVESCPMRAMDFDTVENIQAKYGAGDGHIAPLPDPSITTPNLIIKANRNGQPAGAGAGKILNPNEV
ncbi:dimethylsulfoxide reductase subunit B [Shewanella sp. 1_MG-2023]|uniref:Dimethylsulfoxide reductase subunit B n=1 Tax=Shewanella electrodiphila TaxID=934143 RepID=A0ABT0KTI7_9GAMM|nr:MULTISPECIES: DMSO/selenate family reductase complex B subunit [Shewanella]MCL1047078.1 dimethylsulfoxide reductase subunit B [Shewanella electrodiphila]MDO6612070.1 dimethylsulfoxide reductase subunit B [Shewanella sp. 7_MG-2023]MDO6771854.1 dimethylsulfoxide reductase subunit B [Shewanella sp. 2_MG-2023]MDO6794198.1 dimethylsulfoxide reductase subunit B [Shewanella sp. 1_MG-2023]PMG72280.1 dimethylsulfoxide reductase, chain B [Shewanella sp. 10N.286.51.B7]